jgi:hypothetical protein
MQISISHVTMICRDSGVHAPRDHDQRDRDIVIGGIGAS